MPFNPAWLVIGLPVSVFVLCAAVVAIRELGRHALALIIAWLWKDMWWG